MDRVEAAQITACDELEDLLLLSAHGFEVDLSEEGGKLHFLDLRVFVEVKPDQEVLSAALSTAVGSKYRNDYLKMWIYLK